MATHRRAGDYLGVGDVDLHHVYRSLGVIAEEWEYIQQRLYRNSLAVVDRDTTVLYYDCTNFFFETETADPVAIGADGSRTVGLRQYGVSKEHRPNPIVQMGMFIDNTGFPIALCVNPGNTSEDNRAFNSTAERSFITVQSLNKLNAAYTAWALETKGWKLVPWTVAQRAERDKAGLKAEKDPDTEFDLAAADTAKHYGNRTFYRERWIVNEKTGFSQRIIVTFSYKYRDYLRALRQRQIATAEALVKRGASSKRSATSPARFIEHIYATKEGEVAEFKVAALNLNAIADEEKFDGFYAICTDLNDPADHILRLNHNRWESEDAFRVLKTDFRARPAFVWTDSHIKGHFYTCFIALLLFRVLESELNHEYTSAQIISTLRRMTLNIIPGEGYRPNYTRTDLTDALHDLAGFRTDTEIVTNQKIKQILKMVKQS